MQILHRFSILLEFIVMFLGLMLAILKKKIYGWLIALTFAIYVFYDISRLLSLNVPKNFLYVVFFVATVSILWVVVQIYKES